MYGRFETCGRLSIGLPGVRRTLMLSVAYALLRAVSAIVPALRSRVPANRRVPQRFLDLVVLALACESQRFSACCLEIVPAARHAPGTRMEPDLASAWSTSSSVSSGVVVVRTRP